LPTFARQKRCLTGLTLTNGQTSMHSVNLNIASRLLQSFRLAHLDRSHDAELRHHLKADQSDPIGRQLGRSVKRLRSTCQSERR
jgi:hypothetical protein